MHAWEWGVLALVRGIRFVERAERAGWAAFEEVLCATFPLEARKAYNRLIYAASPTYRRGSWMHRRGLFEWEQRALDTFFPPAPARLLVGGAGGGREVEVLAKAGYEIVAYEPCPSLVACLDEVAGEAPATAVRTLRASHEDLLAGAFPPPIAAGAPYDAVVVGWGSLAYLLEPDSLSRLLRALRVLCPKGPVLASYYAPSPGFPGPLRRRLRAGLARAPQVGLAARTDPGLRWSKAAGFVREHRWQQVEAGALVAGYQVAYRSKPGVFAHVVLVPRGAEAATAPSGLQG